MDYRNYDRGYAEPTMSASDYMTRTYRWMACGLLITFAMAYLTATTSLIYLVDSLYLVLTIAELALVFVLAPGCRPCRWELPARPFSVMHCSTAWC